MNKESEKIRDVLIETMSFSEYEHYYSHNFFCGNCKKNVYKYILKGCLAKEQSFSCPNCGCEVKG